MVALFQLPSARADFGLHAGVGVPFLGQAGINYSFSSQLGLSATYNMLDLDVGTAKVELTMPEVLINYHPFAGAFFIGAGVGQNTLKASSTDINTGTTVSADVTAMTGIAKLGWMWGVSDGGFWFGVDVSYIKPFSPDISITAPGVPTTAQAYQDLVDATETYGDEAFFNITFAKIGYLF